MGKTTQKHIKTATQRKTFFFEMNGDLEKNTQQREKVTQQKEKVTQKLKFLKYYYQCVFKSLCKVEPSNARLMWTMCLCRNHKKNLPL